ncbi:MAG: pyridoxal-phosphate dependent enzyme, partial [Acidobacteria bacterium]|nr:pyridoxal-phosphate dependent enzyme [Acidobacteriota bacterium]
MRTPLRPSPWLSTMAEADVRLKLETLQPSFSYKSRGAFNAVLRLIETGKPLPMLVTASAGNHGRALGHAAAEAGLTLTVYAAEKAPQVKLDAIRRTGALLRRCRDYDDAERQAKQHAASGNASYISAYAHPDVIAGAGTVGLEILEDWPEVDDIVVPIGGGGLISGIAIVAEASARTSVIGVEVEASAPFTHSIEAGRIVEIDVKPTLADGLAGNLDPDTPTFDIVRRLVRRIHVVSESHLKDAIRAIAAEE